jgi:hypothetical protein
LLDKHFIEANAVSFGIIIVGKDLLSNLLRTNQQHTEIVTSP